MKLKVLQIGAGSMGTRRLRDLSVRTDVELALLDKREDRRTSARDRFRIPVFAILDEALRWGPDILVISTPPNQHAEYIELALSRGLHHFCEENIWTFDYRRVERKSREKSLVSVPSCSFHFLPLALELKRIVAEELGSLHSYHMFLSTYEPTWHPGEGKEFYARNRSTAAGREMVPFELVFLNHVFGVPVEVFGSVSRRGNLGVDGEDTWCLQMRLESGATGQLAVLMASPVTIRDGWIAGTNGIVRFDIMKGWIARDLPGCGIHDTIDRGSIAEVVEKLYADEINTFIDAVRGRAVWPHDYRMSAIATATLAAAEKSSRRGNVEKVDPDFQPALFPDGY